LKPNTQPDEKVVKIEVGKSTCKDCKLECSFKGKEEIPRIKDLDKIPQECFYRKEFEKTAVLVAKNLDQHISVMRSAIVAAQQMGSMISQHEVKAILEMSNYYQAQMNSLADSFIRFSEIAQGPKWFPVLESYRNLQPYLEMSREAARLMSVSTPVYFSSKEFSMLEKPIRIPKKSVALSLVRRLDECLKGKEGWVAFQDLCKDILIHLFVPPLMDPFEQSRTESGLHIRDLIFDIPYTLMGFWGYIKDKFDSSALIVECKNYSSPIEGNQVVISSKYFARNRLGRFGIIFSRLEPRESALKEAKRLWIEDCKLILCLTDAHLVKMLELKENGKHPEIVVDNAIHQFLRSLE